MTFSEAAATTVGEASINIAKLIEELTQPYLPIINVEGAFTRMVDVGSLLCSEILKKNCHILLLIQVRRTLVCNSC